MGLLRIAATSGRRFGRMLFYPIARPFEQIGSSAKSLRGAVDELKRVQQENRERSALPDQISDRKERFNHLYEKNEWTESEILEQLASIILTKRVALAMTPIGATLAVVALFNTVGWPLWLLAPAPLFFSLICVLKAFQLTIFQVQLEERSLETAVSVLSRPDFWRKVFT